MQDDLPKYGAKADWGWVFLVLLCVQVLVRLVIHFRNPFDIPVCDRNSLAVDLVTHDRVAIKLVSIFDDLNHIVFQMEKSSKNKSKF